MKLAPCRGMCRSGRLQPATLKQPQRSQHESQNASKAIRVDVGNCTGSYVKEERVAALNKRGFSEARALLETKPPDVVFLDVEMPGGSGFDLLKNVPDATQVVFATAREKYAVQAFAAAALDYLVKPVDPERLADTVARIQKHAGGGRAKTHGDRELDADDDLDDDLDTAVAAFRVGDVVSVPLAGKTASLAVTVGDICWIESLRNYTRVALKPPAELLGQGSAGGSVCAGEPVVHRPARNAGPDRMVVADRDGGHVWRGRGTARPRPASGLAVAGDSRRQRLACLGSRKDDDSHSSHPGIAIDFLGSQNLCFECSKNRF